MTQVVHALEIDPEVCTGKMACMRACPTDAIRVRNGKVQIDAWQCIECGVCIVACPEGAITPHTDTWEDIQKFPFKVAITSPTLFGQFPIANTPEDVMEGLKAIGFDAVYNLSYETELINMAIQDYMDEYKGPLPVISSTCPVVVRLIQVAFPGMVDQLIQIEPPRELAGREAKKYYMEKEGIPFEDIGAIYITPCPAKMAAIKAPAENVKSHLDLAIGINEIYNPLLSAITKLQKDRSQSRSESLDPEIKSKLFFSLALTGGQSRALRESQYITVPQLHNIIHVFEDVEKGKIKRVNFLECYACNSGCIGGPLTVDNSFVARSKIRKFIQDIENANVDISDEVRKRYVKGDYFIRQPIGPRKSRFTNLSIREKIDRVKVMEKIENILPGIDCGLCGSPSCEAFAKDVSNNEAKPTDCVLICPDRIEELKKIYNFDENSIPDEIRDQI